MQEFARAHWEMSQFSFSFCCFAGDAEVYTQVIRDEQCHGSKTSVIMNSVALDCDVEAGEI